MKLFSSAQFQVTIMTHFEVRQLLSRELLSTPFLQVTMTHSDAKTTIVRGPVVLRSSSVNDDPL